MRKEYNDRANAPLVNPGITHGEYMAQRANKPKTDVETLLDTGVWSNPNRKIFIPTIETETG